MIEFENQMDDDLIRQGTDRVAPVHSKNIWKLCSFFIIAVACIFLVDASISYGLRKKKVSKYGAFNHWFEGRCNAQVVINGSSRALVQYDPRIITARTGLDTYNLGLNGTQIDVQLAILKAYLARNKPPSIVIQNLEAFSFVKTKPREIYDPALYTPYLGDRILYDSLKAIDPAVAKWKYIPLYGYTVEDLRFAWARGLLALIGIEERQDYFGGFNPRNLAWTGAFDTFRHAIGEGITYEIDPVGYSALNEIVTLCTERGIELILCYSPEYSEMQAAVLNRSEIMATFKQIADRKDVRFWDFSNSALTKDRRFFYNSQHLNSTGAELFSQAVSERLKSELLMK